MLRRPSAALAFAALLQHAGTPAANQDSKEKAWLVEAICRRLKLSNDETLQILDLTTASKQFFRAREIKESALVRLLSKPNIGEHMELFRAYCLSSSLSLDLYRYCADRIGICKKISSARPLITGRDLLAMGYPPGPMFKTILSMVEDLQFEKRLKSKEEALAYVKSNIQLPLPQNSRSN
jgi:poly(A) polymerase